MLKGRNEGFRKLGQNERKQLFDVTQSEEGIKHNNVGKEAKEDWIEKQVKSGKLFFLKAYQTGKAWRSMASASYFFSYLHFAEKFTKDGVPTKWSKTSWNYCQCEICVKSISGYII